MVQNAKGLRLRGGGGLMMKETSQCTVSDAQVTIKACGPFVRVCGMLAIRCNRVANIFK